MNTKNLPDYYPVCKDLADRMNSKHSDQKQKDPDHNKDLSPELKTYESEAPGSTTMLNAEELTNLSLKSGFSPFQTVILLLKNAFEGHVFLTNQIRPDLLFSQGTLLFQTKPEFMLLSFYRESDRYRPGLLESWKLQQDKSPCLGGINFDLMIHTIIVNQLVRMPVSLFSLYDIRSFSDTLSVNQQALNQQFEMVILGESALGEYEFIRRVNLIYTEKYKEFVHQLTIKEGVLSHYQRKLALALYPNIKTEEELDDLMYKKLVEEQVNRKYYDMEKSDAINLLDPVILNSIRKLQNKTKGLYRLVSKNCSEIHSAADGENRFPELNNIFLEANIIYNGYVSNYADALLQYMRIFLLLSEVVVLRKNKGYAITDNLRFISEFNCKEVLSKENLKSLKRDLNSGLATYRMKSFTDYKMKFVMDNDFTDIHNHFLQKQIDFLDQQIIQIQEDIREVLSMKSDASISKTSENQ
jgi:hypothetical protein